MLTAVSNKKIYHTSGCSNSEVDEWSCGRSDVGCEGNW